MLVLKTDVLVQNNVEFFDRDIYLASILKKETEILFCLNKKTDFCNILEKKGISWCLNENISQFRNEKITGIIWDVNDFQETDYELLRWAQEEKVATIQITDLGLNQQPVDYTIDSSLSFKIPYGDEKKGLFGPEYVVLHHKYRHFNRIVRHYQKNIKNIFLGLSEGIDYKMLKKTIDFFCRHNFRLKIHSIPKIKKSQKKILTKKYPSVFFVGRVESLGRSFFEADIAIITAGELAYKSAACGTLSFYICLNENQFFFASSLENRGVGYSINGVDELLNSSMIDKITSLTLEERKKMGESGKKLVDAKGIYRIIDFFKKKDII